VTGGVLSFGQIGALCGPFVFSLLLYTTGGYGAGWAVCASATDKPPMPRIAATKAIDFRMKISPLQQRVAD